MGVKFSFRAPKFRLPWHRFVLLSPLSPEQAHAALVARVRKGSMLFSWEVREHDDVPFRGSVEARSFRFVRRIRYRNSFLPVISGTLEPRGEGTLVTIRMRLLLPMAIFSSLWLGAVGYFMVATLIDAFAPGHGASSPGFVAFPLGMLLFFCLMVTWGFGYEADVAEERLRVVLHVASLAPPNAAASAG